MGVNRDNWAFSPSECMGEHDQDQTTSNLILSCFQYKAAKIFKYIFMGELWVNTFLGELSLL